MQRPVRLVLVALASAATTSGLAIVVNLATDWKNSFWAWTAVVVLTLFVSGLELVRQKIDESRSTVHPGDTTLLRTKGTQINSGWTWRPRQNNYFDNDAENDS